MVASLGWDQMPLPAADSLAPRFNSSELSKPQFNWNFWWMRSRFRSTRDLCHRLLVERGPPMPHPAKPASTKNPVAVAVGLPDAPVLTTRAARGTGLAFLELNCDTRKAARTQAGA